MQYDINALKDKIIAQLLLIETDNQPKLESAVQDYVANGEERFQALLEYMADIDIDNGGEKVKFLLDRLAEEKDILTQEVLSLFVIAKGAAQSALNNVQDILLQEVKTVLEDVEKGFEDNS